mmetsp:Transcript_104472/g.291414  ORF Transcript_104472/g.291414 Transcript_104472/m.291414 type:complete len:201 (+) Transcript_104472:2-604(+)
MTRRRPALAACGTKGPRRTTAARVPTYVHVSTRCRWLGCQGRCCRSRGSRLSSWSRCRAQKKWRPGRGETRRGQSWAMASRRSPCRSWNAVRSRSGPSRGRSWSWSARRQRCARCAVSGKSCTGTSSGSAVPVREGTARPRGRGHLAASLACATLTPLDGRRLARLAAAAATTWTACMLGRFCTSGRRAPRAPSPRRPKS